MTEGLPEKPSKKGGGKGPGCAVKIVVAFVFLLFGFTFITSSTFPLEFFYHLFVGWPIFLNKNLSALEVNWEMAACGVGALLLAAYGFHRLLVWIRKGAPWKWAWTVSITALILMLFAAAISMAGIVHQISWMAHEPLVESRRARYRTLTNINNAKMIVIALRECQTASGEMPESLQPLQEKGIVDSLNQLQFRPEHGGAREPWIYLGSGLTDDDGKTAPRIILISPSPNHGDWVVSLCNGLVRQMPTEQLSQQFPQILEVLPHLVGRE